MSRLKEFMFGVGCFFRGFKYLLSNPRLWVYAVLPTLINFAIIGLMIGVFVHYYGDIYSWLSAHLGHLGLENANTWYLKIAGALLWFMDVIFQLLIVLVSVILLLIIGYVMALITSGPFNDALSERVETLITGLEPPPFSFAKFFGDIWRVVKAETLKALLLVAFPLALLVLNLIPIAGGPLYILCTCLFGAWDMGFAFADLPMGRKAAPFGERLKFGRRNKWALTGLGFGFVIPFFSLVFAAPLVIGGTILYLENTKSKIGVRS